MTEEVIKGGAAEAAEEDHLHPHERHPSRSPSSRVATQNYPV